MAIVLWKITIINYEKYKLGKIGDEAWVFPGAICILSVASTFVYFLCEIQSIIIGFINPEYGALMDILNKLGGQ